MLIRDGSCTIRHLKKNNNTVMIMDIHTNMHTNMTMTISKKMNKHTNYTIKAKYDHYILFI